MKQLEIWLGRLAMPLSPSLPPPSLRRSLPRCRPLLCCPRRSLPLTSGRHRGRRWSFSSPSIPARGPFLVGPRVVSLGHSPRLETVKKSRRTPPHVRVESHGPLWRHAASLELSTSLRYRLAVLGGNSLKKTELWGCPRCLIVVFEAFGRLYGDGTWELYFVECCV